MASRRAGVDHGLVFLSGFDFSKQPGFLLSFSKSRYVNNKVNTRTYYYSSDREVRVEINSGMNQDSVYMPQCACDSVDNTVFYIVPIVAFDMDFA